MPKTRTARAAAPEASYEQLDPTAITVRNIRHAKPSKRLVESIRENGVLQPIGVLRTATGELVLEFGDRRRQACIEVGIKVPAIVADGTAGDDEAEIRRIFLQLDENDNREDLTAADRAGAVQTLFDFGIAEDVVARRTGLNTAELHAARQVAASETARKIAAQYPLDLAQTAAIAEFEDDKGTVADLVEAAKEGSGRFAHHLQAARDERADRRTINAHAAGLAEMGITVSSQGQHWENLIDRWADDGKKLTPKTHRTCPGNVVTLRVGYGKKVEESWYCSDPKANGHKQYRAPADGTSGKSDEEVSAERVKVLAGNKAWRSAETVRRDWLRMFLGRPKAPEDALLFTLKAFARSDHRLIRYGIESRGSGQHALARELLGLPKDPESLGWNAVPEVYTAMTKTSANRVEVIALAIVLGAYEASTDVHSWRNPAPEVADYLQALVGWGYELSDCEQELVNTARHRQREAEKSAPAADAATADGEG